MLLFSVWMNWALGDWIPWRWLAKLRASEVKLNKRTVASYWGVLGEALT